MISKELSVEDYKFNHSYEITQSNVRKYVLFTSAFSSFYCYTNKDIFHFSRANGHLHARARGAFGDGWLTRRECESR
jgi:hypothetical protein